MQVHSFIVQLELCSSFSIEKPLCFAYVLEAAYGSSLSKNTYK